MLMRVALFVLLALGLVGFGTVAWLQTRPPAMAAVDTPVAAPVTVSVVVAAHALRPGSLLKPDDLTAADIPVNQAAAALRNTSEIRAALFGAMVRHPVSQGDAVSDGSIVRQGDHGFLSAVLDPGMRAVTLGMSQIGSDASLIWPGDHIDLILVREPTTPGQITSRSVSSETVLSDIRVIAVDQQLMQGAMSDEHTQAENKTITLEVSTADAERLAVALKLGKLSVSVRSANVPSAAAKPAQPITWAGDVSRSITGEQNVPETTSLFIYRGAQTAVTRF